MPSLLNGQNSFNVPRFDDDRPMDRTGHGSVRSQKSRPHGRNRCAHQIGKRKNAMKSATKAAFVSTVVAAMALVTSTSSFAIRANAQKTSPAFCTINKPCPAPPRPGIPSLGKFLPRF
jgi:hypothetical protein